MKKILLLMLSLVSLTAMAQKLSYNIAVAQDGTGTHTTIQEAVNAVPDYRKQETRIFIAKGVYKEKVVIPECKQNITFVGESADETIITFDSYAKKKTIYGEEMGTSGSSAFYIYGHDFHAENITFQNTAGPVGQAVALFVAGNRAVFSNCRFKGYQDTLYTYGKLSRQLYVNCYIEGTVDFIFGSSTAYFQNCEIHSLGKGYLTAASTPEQSKYGYVFRYCRMTAEPGVEGVALGRPWRPYAKTVYLSCVMGKHIAAAGWNNWGKESNEQTTFYGEADSEDYDGHAIDLTQRVAWAKQVNADDFTPDKVLADPDKPDWYKAWIE